mgnify:CR=1 FL=1
MTEDKQRTILDNHYESCLDFWKRQGKDDITAMEQALRELKSVKTNRSPQRLLRKWQTNIVKR